jgi:hypothetical protein
MMRLLWSRTQVHSSLVQGGLSARGNLVRQMQQLPPRATSGTKEQRTCRT